MGCTSRLGTQPVRARRRYDNTLRHQLATETRDRIVAAGSELLHRTSIRDWRGLTVRAVADRAGVNERTVYRHFGSERGLRDAVMRRLEKDAGVDLDSMRLGNIAEVTARILEHGSGYPLERRAPVDPTLTDAAQRQHEALLQAVAAGPNAWSGAEGIAAAAVLDVLWSLGSYERLVVDWHLDRDEAISALTWVVGLVEEAVVTGRRPHARE